MEYLSYTLLADGSSDIRLSVILSWLLRQHLPQRAINGQWADLSRLPQKPPTLAARMEASINLYPCDILFVHRDAEGQPPHVRHEEVLKAQASSHTLLQCNVICVVPIRMQEAWLLSDQQAIRAAAGNPRGRTKHNLPPSSRIERLPDPKTTLYDLLARASELSHRRRKRLPVSAYAYRVAELTEDFSPLRHLTAFAQLEADLVELIMKNHWDQSSDVSPR